MKKQNGITLIALVITIIILLILAGVSLNAVVGQNGILTQAQSAVTKNRKAQVLEEAQMALASWETDYLTARTEYEGRSAQTDSEVVIVCADQKIIATDVKNAKIYVADFVNYETLGEWVEIDPAADDPVTKQIYAAMNPKIPNGFVHTEGEWNTGFVIKEIGTGTEAAPAGDEFVWVPVISESSYIRRSGSRNWHMSAQNTNDCGKDITQYILGDDLGAEVTSILDFPISSTDRVGNTAANIPEAAVVNAAGGFYVSRYEIGIKTRIADTTGATNQAAADWVVSNLVSQKGYEPARNISQTTSLTLANTWKSGTASADGTKCAYQSGLITGTEWDTMCNFIGWSTCDGDCTTWGNYRNNFKSKAYSNIKIAGNTAGTWIQMASWQRVANSDSDRRVFATGDFEREDGTTTAKKNIYDVAGNVWEWTTEKPTQNGEHRVIRGGSAGNYGDGGLATYRHGYHSAGDTAWNFGFRAVLYVK